MNIKEIVRSTQRTFSPLGDQQYPLSYSWAQSLYVERALKASGTCYWGHTEGTIPFSEDGKDPVYEKLVGEMGGQCVRQSFQLNRALRASRPSSQIVFDNGFVEIEAGFLNHAAIHAVSDSLEFMQELASFFEQKISKAAEVGLVYMLVSTSAGVKLKSVGNVGRELSRDNYTPSVIADYDEIIADLKRKTPRGRLVVFDGPPGAGKTYMMRGMLCDASNAMYVIVPSGMVNNMVDPAFLPVLLDYAISDRPIVLIIEDADHCLMKRSGENLTVISTLLNLSDGMVGAALDIRVVCSTNLRKGDLDPAVTRAGRLSRKTHVGELPAAQANELLVKLKAPPDVEQFTGPVVLATVYQRACAGDWSPANEEKAPIGFRRPELPSNPAVQKLLKENE